MLDQNQAKQVFRSTLSLFLGAVCWPPVAALLAIILARLGFKYMGATGVLFFLIWLILFIWLFVQLWQLAKEVGVTPWAALWLFLPGFGLLIAAMLFLEPLKYQADGKPENRRLPLSWALIKNSWKFYTDNFKTSLKTSIWYLYLFLILGALTAAADFWQPALAKITAAVLVLPVSLVSLYIMLRLFAQTAPVESGQTGAQPLKIDRQKYLSYLWIMVEAVVIAAGPFILVCLIVVAVALLVVGWQSVLSAVMPAAAGQPGLASLNLMTVGLIAAMGLILAIPAWLWLMYKSTAWNSLAMPVFLFQDKKGRTALKECDRIARNQWWGLFWKNQLAGLVFGAYSMLISLGMSVAAALLASLFQLLHAGNILASFVAHGLNGVIQMIVMPLFIAYSLKLYRAFYRTAG